MSRYLAGAAQLSSRRTPWLVATFALALGCTELFGPEPLVRPPLDHVEIDDLATSLRHGGIIYLVGFPRDTSFRLAATQRVPVEVAVSSGDREEAGFYRAFCPPRERQGLYNCFAFIILMDEGRDARDLGSHVAAMGGRFHIVSVSGRVAGVTLFDPRDLVERARRARSWLGVAYTELSFAGCQTPGCASRSHLMVPVPVDTGAAAMGDGVVQVRPGDTVVVVYHQPFGGTVEARRVVPSPP